MGEEGSFDRSIDGCIRPSVTRLCRSRLVAREPRRVRNIGRARGAPRAPPCTQLSHLPIGPSHVLICLLVNPPFPSLIVYFVLSYFLSLFSTFVKPLCPFLSPSRLLLTLFFFFRSSFEGSFPFLSVLPFRSLSPPLERNRTVDHSKMDWTDRPKLRSTSIIFRMRGLKNLAYLYERCYTICALSI